LPYEELPNLGAKNVSIINPLRRGTFVIMKNKTRTYIGEVLDIYKKLASGRHGSLKDANTPNNLSYLSLRVFLPLQNVHNLYLMVFFELICFNSGVEWYRPIFWW
jgi:hypothetical protein